MTKVNAQVINSSFEIPNDSLPNYPKDWDITKSDAVEYSLTSETTASGNTSFLVDLTNNETNNYYVFTQDVAFQGKKLQRVLLTYFIKTDIVGRAGVTWQVLDKNETQTNYTYSGMQDQESHGKSDWQKHTLVLSLDEKCAKFQLGGYAKGKGQVWFDDLKIEELVLPDTKPSKVVKQYFKSFKKIVKDYSLYADSLDWKQIDKDLNALTRGINSMDDLGAPKDYMLNKLRQVGDNHSFLSSKANYETSQQSQTSTSVPYSKLLEKNIGYINVPDFSSRNDSVNVAFATTIQELIKELDTQNDIQTWIVDLRDNPGGNMHPMLAGLGPLTGEGNSGHFVSPRDHKSETWFYRNGGFGVGTDITTQVKNPYHLKQSNPKIAVLIGAKTSSSGEMTAVAFIGKENTRLFGQTSSGYTTTNSDFELPDGARIYLASGFVSDRNHKLYLKNIQPEITIVEDEKDVDKTLKAAIDWLKL